MDQQWPQFPKATIQPFAGYLNKYAGAACVIVGRGPTSFDYRELSRSTDPVFFINDAVCMEKYAGGESFYFAHDPQALAWLNGQIRSTAVLPIDGKIFRDAPGIVLEHPGNIVFYHWREQEKEQLLLMTREELAQFQQLYTHTGTIHSLLHFVWFCGFLRVTFIGCNGIPADGYDPRLENRSGSIASLTYPAILQAQQLLSALFGLEATYVR